MLMKNKYIKYFSFSSVAVIVVQVLQLAIISIVAKDLTDNDFGIFTLSVLIMNFGLLLAECGSGSFLICYGKFDRRTISTCLNINVIISLIIYFILSISIVLWSEFISYIYTTPVLILSISLLFLSCSQIPKSILEYDGNFKIIAICDMLSAFISFLIALIIYDYISPLYVMIFFSLSVSIIKTIMYFLYDKKSKYSFLIDKKIMHEVRMFSSGLVLNNILVFFSRNNDQMLIGKLIGLSQLGNYSLAMKFSLQPILRFTSILQRVIMPDLSKCRDSNELNLMFNKVFNLLIIVMIPMSILIYFISDSIVKIFLGEEWTSVSIIIKTACLLPFTYSIIQLTQNIILVNKNTILLFKIQILSTLMSVFFVFIACYYFNVNYVAIFMTLSMIMTFIFSLYYIRKLYFISIILDKVLIFKTIFFAFVLYIQYLFTGSFDNHYIVISLYMFTFILLSYFLLKERLR